MIGAGGRAVTAGLAHSFRSAPLKQYQHAGPSTFGSPRQLAVRFAHSPAESLAFPTHTSSPTPYEIFHFTSRSVSQSEIKARYYDLVRVLHPDRFAASTLAADSKGKEKGGSVSKSLAEEHFKMVVDAYNLLKDPYKKKMYDRAGLGWSQSGLASTSHAAGRQEWSPWVDRRYTRRGNGHDRYAWQNNAFYSNQYRPPGRWHGSGGWHGGNGQYTSNGIFISSIFLLTWVLAGMQYSRLSLQSQKAADRADKLHLDAAQSLRDARETARSEQGQARLQAFRRRAREQRTLEELDLVHTQAFHAFQNKQAESSYGHAEPLLLTPPQSAEPTSRYGVGHGGPSGKKAAEERFERIHRVTQQTSES